MEAVAGMATDSGPKKSATIGAQHQIEESFYAAYTQSLSPAILHSKRGTSIIGTMPAIGCHEARAQARSTGFCGARNA